VPQEPLSDQPAGAGRETVGFLDLDRSVAPGIFRAVLSSRFDGFCLFDGAPIEKSEEFPPAVIRICLDPALQAGAISKPDNVCARGWRASPIG